MYWPNNKIFEETRIAKWKRYRISVKDMNTSILSSKSISQRNVLGVGEKYMEMDFSIVSFSNKCKATWQLGESLDPSWK